MPENELGYVNKSNLRRWTNQAKDCYLNGLDCSICTLDKDLKARCRMKPVVLELVKKFGKPSGKGVEFDPLEQELRSVAD